MSTAVGKPWAGLLLTCCLGVGARLLLFSLDGYRSTDFEVHRNWLAITGSLPIQQWYTDKTSQWTLDYPPLFAWFEWLVSCVARQVDPNMVKVTNLNYASRATVAFQRLSVIVCDLLVLFPATWWLCSVIARYANSHYGRGHPMATGDNKTTNGATEVTGAVQVVGATNVTGAAQGQANQHLAAALCVCLDCGLLIIDHIHFQYNGLVVGILFLALAAGISGRAVTAAIFFSSLLHLKHTFLYAAPSMALFLIQDFVLRAADFNFGSSLGPLLRFALLGGVTLGVSALSLGPFALYGQLRNIKERLFPFERGLVHSFWAPNFWAIYLGVDRVLFFIHKLFSPQPLFSGALQPSEAGKRNPVLLPAVSPSASLLCVGATCALVLLLQWLVLSKRERRQLLPIFVALGNYAGFLFGWHVHEKAILYTVLPLYAIGSFSADRQVREALLMLSGWSVFSLLPLLPTVELFPLKLSLWVLNVCIHAGLHQCSFFSRDGQVETELKPPGRAKSPVHVTAARFPATWLALSSLHRLLVGASGAVRCQFAVMLLAIVYEGAGWRLAPLASLEFLPLLVVSCAAAVGIFLNLYTVVYLALAASL